MNVYKANVYGQIQTPTESPQSSVANTTTGLTGVGQASTYGAAVETALSSLSTAWTTPASTDPSILNAAFGNFIADNHMLYGDIANGQIQAGKYL